MTLKKYFFAWQKNLYMEGAFSFANFTLLNGIFLIGFALSLGANTFQIGMLVSLPLFANLLQLVSAFILEATGTKKWTTLLSLFLARILWIIAIALAFKSHALLILMLIVLISSCLTAVGNLALLSWMKDMVPFSQLAQFWGKRNMAASSGGIIVYLLGAYLIDRFTGKHIFAFIFGASILIGMVALLFLLPMPEKKTKIRAISPGELASRLRMPFMTREFKPLLIFSLLWGFAINVAAPFFLVYMIDDLSLGFFLVSVFLLIDALARIYGLNHWAKVAKRFGARPLLTVCATVTSIVPLAFIFSDKSSYGILPFIFVISAFSYAAVDICVGQLLFKSAPRKYGAYYLSTFSSLVGLSSAFGPILGGLVATLLKNNVSLPLFSPLKYVFLLSFILRASCIPFISRINEPKARNVEDILQTTKTLKFVSFFANIYSFADYASKIVLVPQKQLFVLQRKAFQRAQKYGLIMMQLMQKTIIRIEKPDNTGLANNGLGAANKQLAQMKEQIEGTTDSELRTVHREVVARISAAKGQKSNTEIRQSMPLLVSFFKSKVKKLTSAYKDESKK